MVLSRDQFDDIVPFLITGYKSLRHFQFYCWWIHCTLQLDRLPNDTHSSNSSASRNLSIHRVIIAQPVLFHY